MVIHLNGIIQEIDTLYGIERKISAISKQVSDCNSDISECPQAHTDELVSGLKKIQMFSEECGQDIKNLAIILERIYSEYKKCEHRIVANMGSRIQPETTVKTIKLTDISDIINKM